MFVRLIALSATGHFSPASRLGWSPGRPTFSRATLGVQYLARCSSKMQSPLLVMFCEFYASNYFIHAPADSFLEWHEFGLLLARLRYCQSVAFLSQLRRESLRKSIVASTTALGPKWVKNASLDISSLGSEPVPTLTTLLICSYLLLERQCP